MNGEIKGLSILDIADKCNEKFFEAAIDWDFDQVLSFVSKELERDVFTSHQSFEQYQEAYQKKASETINPKEFLHEEIKSAQNFISEPASKIPETQKIHEYIKGTILIGRDKRKVLEYFFRKCHHQEDIKNFVYAVYAFDLIKYLLFLKNEPLAQNDVKAKTRQPPNKAKTT